MQTHFHVGYKQAKADFKGMSGVCNGKRTWVNETALVPALHCPAPGSRCSLAGMENPGRGRFPGVMPCSVIPWETICPKSWAVAHHLSPTSCCQGFLPFLLPVPFQKQPGQKLMKKRQTDRQTDLQIFTDASHYSPIQEIRTGSCSTQSLGLGAFAGPSPGLPSSLHQS